MDDILDVLQEILETDRSFHREIHLLQGSTRNHLVASQLRNTSLALSILRLAAVYPPPTTMVMNIPITMDASGSFFDAVPITPTRAQITAATEREVAMPPSSTCAICQDAVTSATRIRACNHTFHAACLDQWLQLNPRCPVCRHDVRNLQSPANPTANE